MNLLMGVRNPSVGGHSSVGVIHFRLRALPGQLDLSITQTQSVELQDVVGQAEQRPLAANLIDSAQQKLTKSAPLFDLTEDRLDDRFPHSTHGSLNLVSILRCIRSTRVENGFPVI